MLMIKNRNFIEFKNFNHDAAIYLEELILDLLKCSKDINICIPGGKTPIPIFKTLFKTISISSKINLYLNDERNYHNNQEESNFLNLLKTIPINSNIVLHPVFTQKGDINSSIANYNKLIKKLPMKNAKPFFDLMILGMGLDGHIASLFPGTKAIEEKNKFFIKNYVSALDEFRFTITYPLILNSGKIFLLIKGKEKKDLIKKNLKSYPVMKILNKRKDTEILCSN